MASQQSSCHKRKYFFFYHEVVHYIFSVESLLVLKRYLPSANQLQQVINARISMFNNSSINNRRPGIEENYKPYLIYKPDMTLKNSIVISCKPIP